jgi:hypothetical protein
MTTRKPKRSRPGDALKEMQRTAKIRQQQDTERQRHRSAMVDLNLRRELARRKKDPEVQAIDLQRISHKEIDETRRHQSKMESLQNSIFRKS